KSGVSVKARTQDYQDISSGMLEIRSVRSPRAAGTRSRLGGGRKWPRRKGGCDRRGMRVSDASGKISRAQGMSRYNLEWKVGYAYDPSAPPERFVPAAVPGAAQLDWAR